MLLFCSTGNSIMSSPNFGGPWTERKLTVVRRYLEIYVQALKQQPFERLYIDAFAGTGDRAEKRLESLPLLDLLELDAITKGSARLALEVNPPFDRYVLIERVARRASELSALVEAYPDRNITTMNADANEAIVDLCRTSNWRGARGVVFLDPYGLQVAWDTLVAISGTRALDVWILFPTGIGLNRLLTKDGNIPAEWQESLDRFIGTRDWREAFYKVEEATDLFGAIDRRLVKDADAGKFEMFLLNRLKSIFPTVMERGVPLTNSKGQTMYLLLFASANPSQKVKALALRLANWATEV
jgi:three-Cys-motif partner protein